tara:strand:+ start:1748 stop:1945 length:198 start_codon:yes stop_codon:yes gene_type:complete
MIEEDEYFFLLSVLSLMKEQMQINKKRKKSYVHWTFLITDLERILNDYEKMWDDYIDERKEDSDW